MVCEPAKNSTNGKTSQAGCAQKKEVNAVAVCDFCADLWNLGGTCIKNHLDGLALPDCPKSSNDAKMKVINAAIAMIKPMCKQPTRHDQRHCTKLAMSY